MTSIEAHMTYGQYEDDKAELKMWGVKLKFLRKLMMRLRQQMLNTGTALDEIASVSFHDLYSMRALKEHASTGKLFDAFKRVQIELGRDKPPELVGVFDKIIIQKVNDLLSFQTHILKGELVVFEKSRSSMAHYISKLSKLEAAKRGRMAKGKFDGPKEQAKMMRNKEKMEVAVKEFQGREELVRRVLGAALAKTAADTNRLLARTMQFELELLKQQMLIANKPFGSMAGWLLKRATEMDSTMKDNFFGDSTPAAAAAQASLFAAMEGNALPDVDATQIAEDSPGRRRGSTGEDRPPAAAAAARPPAPGAPAGAAPGGAPPPGAARSSGKEGKGAAMKRKGSKTAGGDGFGFDSSASSSDSTSSDSDSSSDSSDSDDEAAAPPAKSKQKKNARSPVRGAKKSAGGRSASALSAPSAKGGAGGALGRVRAKARGSGGGGLGLSLPPSSSGRKR
jgi:hypothetical protein